MAPIDTPRPGSQPTPRPGGMAGGFFLAFSLIAGVVIGTAYRQPTIGFLVGLGVGLFLIGLVWFLDRRPR